MRHVPLVLLLVACGAPTAADAGVNDSSLDAGPQPYVDITFQTRCGSTPCTPPPQRDILGFAGMGQQVSCTVTSHGGMRDVALSAAAMVGSTRIGVSITETVAAGGGPPIGACQFDWTDEGIYVGQCSEASPTPAFPCQVSYTAFSTDTATGLPLLDVNVYCVDAPGAMGATRSFTRAGSLGPEATMPATLHVYSCAGL